MDGRLKPKRIAPVSYRPPESLREEFLLRVQNSGLPVNAFITAAVFGDSAPKSRRKASRDGQLGAVLLSQAARLADQLRLIRDADDPYAIFLIEQCRDELAEIRTVLMTMQGRSP